MGRKKRENQQVFRFADHPKAFEVAWSEDGTKVFARVRIIDSNGVGLQETFGDGQTENAAVYLAVSKSLNGYIDFAALELYVPSVGYSGQRQEDGTCLDITQTSLAGRYHGVFTPRGYAFNRRPAKSYGLALLDLCGALYLREKKQRDEAQQTVAVVEELVGKQICSGFGAERT